MNQADKNIERFEELQRQLIKMLEEETLESIEQKNTVSANDKERETWEWLKNAKIYYDSRCNYCKGGKIIVNPDNNSNKLFVECPECNGIGKK